MPSLDILQKNIAPRVGKILEKALAERDISPADAVTLFETQGADFLALIAIANELRQKQVGDNIAYVKVRNINFTNVCYTGCKFCAFARHADDPEAYTMTLDEVAAQALEAVEWGCTEVCMQGGLNPKLGGDIYLQLVKAVKAVAPQLHIHAFSPFEIDYAAKRLRQSPEKVLRDLKDAGLGSLPGTAAEIFHPDVRGILTQHKFSAEAWESVIKTAHRVRLPSTATIMYGHVDAPPHWAHHLDALRRIQRETGGFTEFVPLGFIHQNTQLYAEGLARTGPTGMESIKMHAVSRLMLGRDIPNLQVSWVKLGTGLAQMCLNAGANDFGGTLMEERISKMAGATNGSYMPPDEFERLILDMGRVPVERDTLYKIIPH